MSGFVAFWQHHKTTPNLTTGLLSKRPENHQANLPPITPTREPATSNWQSGQRDLDPGTSTSPNHQNQDPRTRHPRPLAPKDHTGSDHDKPPGKATPGQSGHDHEKDASEHHRGDHEEHQAGH